MEIHVGDIFIATDETKHVILEVGEGNHLFSKPLLDNGNLGMGGTTGLDQIKEMTGGRMGIDEIIQRASQWFYPGVAEEMGLEQLIREAAETQSRKI